MSINFLNYQKYSREYVPPFVKSVAKGIYPMARKEEEILSCSLLEISKVRYESFSVIQKGMCTGQMALAGAVNGAFLGVLAGIAQGIIQEVMPRGAEGFSLKGMIVLSAGMGSLGFMMVDPLVGVPKIAACASSVLKKVGVLHEILPEYSCGSPERNPVVARLQKQEKMFANLRTEFIAEIGMADEEEFQERIEAILENPPSFLKCTEVEAIEAIVQHPGSPERIAKEQRIPEKKMKGMSSSQGTTAHQREMVVQVMLRDR